VSTGIYRGWDAWSQRRENDERRLAGAGEGSGGAYAHPPDDAGASWGACLLWIRRQGWLSRVDAWMIAWVQESRS
jgi:hypothetical protein